MQIDNFPAADASQGEHIAKWPTVTYTELGSKRIRLVRLIPGPPGSIIGCEVGMCFLEQSPSYTAVSYTWGSPLGFRDILVGSQPHSVPKNLWRFLDQARKLPGSDRLAGWLWIDALSIDQSDPQEKLNQVGIISSIFRNAEHVIVWLGPSYMDSDYALATMYPDSTTGPIKYSKTLAGPVWPALYSLCERPYWRRLWVYQELKSALRTELMCGSRLVPLRNFRRYLSDPVAPRLQDKFELLRKSSAGMTFRLLRLPPKMSLWSLLASTSHLRCVDPRDKAYAVLSIADTGEQGIQADYTIPVPVLLNRILVNEHNIKAPESLHQVGKQCMDLERWFDEPSNSIFVTKGPVKSDRHINLLEQLASEREPVYPELTVLFHEWADFYSHKCISRLLLRRSEDMEIIGKHGDSPDRPAK